MIEIAHLEVSTLYLFKEQTHPGRCVVAYKEHAGGQTDIPEGEWVKFMLDTRRAVNPKETYLTDEEYASVISKIREAL